MNNTQRTSAARYCYDVSKVCVAATLAIAVGESPLYEAIAMGAAAAFWFYLGWEIEDEH